LLHEITRRNGMGREESMAEPKARLINFGEGCDGHGMSTQSDEPSTSSNDAKVMIADW